MNLVKELKKRPDTIWLLPINALTIFFQFLILGDSIFQVLPIAEDSALQVIGTGAEIVAGLYGLTLTGYIFFMDYLQEQIRDNALVSEVVKLLRRRYYKIICVISAQTIIAIVAAIILNFYDLQSEFLPAGILRFLVDECLFLMITVVIAIVYFVLDIVNPDKIAKVSQKHKELMEEAEEEIESAIPVDIQLEETRESFTRTEQNVSEKVNSKQPSKKFKMPAARKEEKGNVQEFIKDYQEIEVLLKNCCKGLVSSYVPRESFTVGGMKEFMIPLNAQNPRLFAKISRLQQYYCYMMFSKEQTVSKKMCILAKEVKAELIKMNLGE